MPTLVSWTYDDAGRVLTRSWNNSISHVTSYEYDANGNRTRARNQDGSTISSEITATYDRLNRPLTVAVVGDSGAATTYTYNLTSPSMDRPEWSIHGHARQVRPSDLADGSHSRHALGVDIPRRRPARDLERTQRQHDHLRIRRCRRRFDEGHRRRADAARELHLDAQSGRSDPDRGVDHHRGSDQRHDDVRLRRARPPNVV